MRLGPNPPTLPGNDTGYDPFLAIDSKVWSIAPSPTLPENKAGYDLFLAADDEFVSSPLT